MMDALASNADLEHLMVDGSIVRVHQHGAAAKKTTKDIEAMGKSREGLGTKIHTAVMPRAIRYACC